MKFSYACLIDEGDTFLITGGFVNYAGVSRYNSDGWVENTGSLNAGRGWHGCTRYTNNIGAQVIITIESKRDPQFVVRLTSCVVDGIVPSTVPVRSMLLEKITGPT